MKKVVICDRCGHGHIDHHFDGKHQCLHEDCPCNYFIFSNNVEFVEITPVAVGTEDNLELDSVLEGIPAGIRNVLFDSSPASEGYVPSLDIEGVTVVNPEALKNGEVRTTSATGGQKGMKPERFDLVPVYPLTVLARLYAFGAEKYAAHNYRKGYEFSKSYAALIRHATQFWNGEDNDQETGLPHMASVVFHAFALIEFVERFPEFDDRFKPEEKTGD